ncbi:MAG: glycosyl transferase family 2 [Xanthomonadaceae bacterium]|nr:glycosyl transferase family 2 [Xanthomonadaceae bacterium]
MRSPVSHAGSRAATPELSIVIPVGPNDESWHGLLSWLEPLDLVHEVIFSACQPPPADLSVLAGNSRANRNRARWLTGKAGRARQLNLGVQRARANTVWLLHADCRPELDALRAAERFVRADSGTLGWFDLAFDPDGPGLTRWNARGANLRSRLLGLPFGDQGWIIETGLIEEIGGFDEQFGPGEDLDFVVRARAAGVGLQALGATLNTSARRFADHGWLETTGTHLWLTLKLWIKSKNKPGTLRK